MATMKRQAHSKSNGKANDNGGLIYVSRKEILKEIEEEAREIRGIGAHELLSTYRRGKLKNPGEVFHLLVLSDLLPKNDPIFA